MLSHHYKCIFIHIPKNAGQSVEHLFLSMLDLDWNRRAPLLLGLNPTPELGPPRLAHLTAEDYTAYCYVSPEMFEQYFKFAFVRNPWGRLVSTYKFFGFQRKLPFKEFLLTAFQDKLWSEKYWFVRPQTEFIFSKEGEQLVDFIGRFENLQGDFDIACQKMGFSPVTLPHVNKVNPNYRPPRPKLLSKKNLRSLALLGRTPRTYTFARYQDYYDDESKALVAKFYKRDIELLGYCFEPLNELKAAV